MKVHVFFIIFSLFNFNEGIFFKFILKTKEYQFRLENDKKINRKRKATHCNVFYSKIRSIIKRCLCMGLEQSNSYQRGETPLTLQPHGKLKWLVLIEGSIHQSNKKK